MERHFFSLEQKLPTLMGSSCCMDGCLLSLPAACPGISKGFYQACIMSPSPTPMQMAKLPLNTWSYPVAEHCLQGKGNGFFPPPGDGQRPGGLRLLDHSWVQHRKAGLNNSSTAPVSAAQARLRGLETARIFSSVNLCSSWELLHSSIWKSCGYLGYTEEGSAFDTHCTENKCICGGRRQAKHRILWASYVYFLTSIAMLWSLEDSYTPYLQP